MNTNTATNATPRPAPVYAQTPEGAPVLCPKCGKEIMVRTNKKDSKQFLGCSGFSSGSCKHTMPMPTNDKDEVTPGHEPDITTMCAPEKAEPHPAAGDTDVFDKIFGDQKA